MPAYKIAPSMTTDQLLEELPMRRVKVVATKTGIRICPTAPANLATRPFRRALHERSAEIRNRIVCSRRTPPFVCR